MLLLRLLFFKDVCFIFEGTHSLLGMFPCNHIYMPWFALYIQLMWKPCLKNTPSCKSDNVFNLMSTLLIYLINSSKIKHFVPIMKNVTSRPVAGCVFVVRKSTVKVEIWPYSNSQTHYHTEKQFTMPDPQV